MDNHFLFENIKKMSFYDNVPKILNLLEKHLERLVFVKSSKGLDNVLFLSELNAKSFDSPFFLKLDNFQTKPDVDSFLSKGLVFNFDVILVQLEEFFVLTDSPLYVEIGFVCSHPDQTTFTKIYNSLIRDNTKNIEDLRLEYIVVPSFYKECPHSSDIIKSFNLFEELEYVGEELNKLAIKEYKEKIDIALLENDINSFKEYSEKLMKLTTR